LGRYFAYRCPARFAIIWLFCLAVPVQGASPDSPNEGKHTEAVTSNSTRVLGSGVPVYGRISKAWADTLLECLAANALLRGQKAFEPDFVLNLTQRSFTGKELELDGDERIVTPEKIFDERGAAALSLQHLDPSIVTRL
jgi:hypothetical protein